MIAPVREVDPRRVVTAGSTEPRIRRQDGVRTISGSCQVMSNHDSSGP